MNTKEQADDLFNNHYKMISIEDFTEVPSSIVWELKKLAIHHAIKSVEHTIEVLEEVIIRENVLNNIDELITEQTELLNELKSRI